MALQATLKIEGKSYDVRDMDYDITKPVDNNNKPSATAKGGLINFTILSPMDGNLVFHEWVTKIAETKSGEFILPLTHGIKHTTKTIKFELAHCTRLQEFYSSSTATSQMYLRISITCSVIKFSEKVEFRNNELQ